MTQLQRIVEIFPQTLNKRLLSVCSQKSLKLVNKFHLKVSTEQNSIAKQYKFRPIDYLGKWKVVTARGSDEKQTHTHNLLTVLPPNV